MPDFYIAPVNDDGTIGEPQKWEGVREITPIIESSSNEVYIENILNFTPSEITFEFEPPVWMIFAIHHMQMSVLKSCSTCRNCMEMYRYPGFVTAEECECTEGLECDTYFDKVRDCPKYEYRSYFEPRKRNPDLDKYMYVMKGDKK